LRNSFKLDFGARAGKLFVLCLHFCLINFTKRQRKWCPCTSKQDKETEDRTGLGDSETQRQEEIVGTVTEFCCCQSLWHFC